MSRGPSTLLRAAVSVGVVTGAVAVVDSPAPAAPVASVVASPNGPSSLSSLNGVACVITSDCFAVGADALGGGRTTLVEHWDGNSWSVVPSPNAPGTIDDYLTAVTCTSSTFCVAVGSAVHPPDADLVAPSDPLVEQWDGTAWTVVATPGDNSPSNFPFRVLDGVACTSSTDCFAVGHVTNGVGFETLTEHWNGTGWTVVPSPNRVAVLGGPQVLSSIACTTATSCLAVGYAEIQIDSEANARIVTLVERWNGTSWKIVPSPNPNPSASILESVACTASTSCFATGAYDGKSSLSTTLIERWNGTSWKVVPSPTPAGTKRSHLSAVVCTSGKSCLAVGSGPTVQAKNTLLEHWNGTKWSLVTSPVAGAPYISLAGVACKGFGVLRSRRPPALRRDAHVGRAVLLTAPVIPLPRRRAAGRSRSPRARGRWWHRR